MPSARGASASAESLIALLAEFGVRLDGAADAGRALEAAHRARWAQALPPVRVVQAGSAAWSVSLRLPASMRRLRWQLGDEQGRELQGEADAEALPETGRIDIDGICLCERVLQMPLALEAGYHRLRIEGLRGETLVLATPGRCYRPPAVRDGGRVWGTAVQLYSAALAAELGHRRLQRSGRTRRAHGSAGRRTSSA